MILAPYFEMNGDHFKLLAIPSSNGVEPLDGGEHGMLRCDDAEVVLRIEWLACFGADLLAGLEKAWNVCSSTLMFVDSSFLVDDVPQLACNRSAHAHTVCAPCGLYSRGSFSSNVQLAMASSVSVLCSVTQRSVES